MSAKPPLPFSIDRLHTLASELRASRPNGPIDWNTSKRSMNCVTWSVSYSTFPTRSSPRRISAHRPHASHMHCHIHPDNLHQGMSLKVLANFLGYSEKYCSDLFARIMGEPFSTYLRRYRVERGSTLLRSSGQTLAEIAASLGFSDQFAFSHFFKRATGQSPLELRMLTSGGTHAKSIARSDTRPPITPHSSYQSIGD